MRPKPPLPFGIAQKVSIHAPTRGATLHILKRSSIGQFQSTHPLGVRPSGSISSTSVSEFQSTHPLGVRLWLAAVVSVAATVSIHAPTRGATPPLLLPWDISKFQSTHPLGVRPVSASAVRRALSVSIHAPTRGATPQPPVLWHCPKFQSTHPLGVRLSA